MIQKYNRKASTEPEANKIRQERPKANKIAFHSDEGEKWNFLGDVFGNFTPTKQFQQFLSFSSTLNTILPFTSPNLF